MPKKKPLKKHSVKATLQVVELTRAGSSLDLEIYADKLFVGLAVAWRSDVEFLTR